MLAPTDVLSDEFVRARLSLTFPDGEDGEPLIIIGLEVFEAMNSLWKNCMLVKVLGRSVPIAVLSKKLRELWKPIGAMHVVDLPRQYFMVRFESEEEYLTALTGGPWRVFGSYLLVQAWSPDFDPMKDEIVTTPVWVRLSNIPLNLYHPSILMGITGGLGNLIKVDMTTLTCERARFARVCVEVNLRKPLKGTVMINEDRYFVAYEGLTNICSGCGLYGHLVHNCPQVKQSNVVKATQSIVAVETSLAPVSQSVDGFTTVGQSGRRGTKQPATVVFAAGGTRSGLGKSQRDLGKKSDSANISVTNSFGSLLTDMEGTDLSADVVELEGNKENEEILIQSRNEKKVIHGNVVPLGENSKRANEGARIGKKDKRNGLKKVAVSNGPRPNQMNHVRPTRGLVFGPTRGEMERSFNGKRLRIEEKNPGRPGGVFTQTGDGSSNVENSGQGRVVKNMVGQLDSNQSTMPMEETMRSVPQGSGNGNMVA